MRPDSIYTVEDRMNVKTEWQPIETAQTDGGEIILWNGEEVAAGSYSFAYGWMASFERGCGDDGLEMIPKPTHWMPLPDPPEMVRDVKREIGSVESASSTKRLDEYDPESPPEHLRWKGDGPPPASWYVGSTKVYRSYADYCDD